MMIFRLSKWIVIIVFLLSTILFVYLWKEVSSYDGISPEGPPHQAAIVLGAAFWGTKPSPALQERLDQAYMLYEKGLIKFIVLSGGLGKNKVTEAEGMRNYLNNKEVPLTDLILENKSTSTWENLLYSSDILKRYSFPKVYIVTHDYHMSRAMHYARKIGITATAAPVHSKVLFMPYHKIRESFALLFSRFRELL